MPEGETKGQTEGLVEVGQRGKVKVVEGPLRVGVTWKVIEAATGLTEAGLEALKAQMAGSDVAP